MRSRKQDCATYHLIGPHSEEVGHQSGEARSKAALGDEAKFQFSQTDGVVTSLPVPARNVEQIRLNIADDRQTRLYNEHKLVCKETAHHNALVMQELHLRALLLGPLSVNLVVSSFNNSVINHWR